MRWFRRRRHGRHELGHAVTAIPSQAPAVEPPAAPAPPAGPQVELGFKDGTTARLDPASDQAKALEDLARSLRE